MKIVNLIAAAALGVATIPATAFAQDGCTCTTPAPAAGPVGSIVSASGAVSAGGAAAGAGDPIANGTEIQVGDASSAQISVGSCALTMGANSVIRVSSLANGNLCLSGSQAVAAAEVPAGGTAGGWIVPAGFVALAGTAVLLELGNDGDGGVSR